MTEPTPDRPTEEPSGPERTEREVQYKGAPLDSAKGPGLGCFWAQVALLAVVVILAPLSAVWEWPLPVSIVLLALMLVLLLFTGQTAIFLMRLVAADRRAEGRRRPMRSATRTVGEIEDEPTLSAEERHTGGPRDGGVRE